VSADPSTIGLDPEWIAAQVATNGRAPTSVEFMGFIGTGQMSRNARFSITWADNAGPESVVVKVPSSVPATRSISFEHGIYQKECDFYRSIAPLVDVSVPLALGVHFDAAGQDFAIVLEDLTGSEQGDQFTEPSRRQLGMAMAQAAALQAPVWGKTDGPAFAPYRDDMERRAAIGGEMIPVLLDAVFDRLGPDLDDGIGEMLQRFAPLAGGWIRLKNVPITLVHGDFRPDNFMFGVRTGAPPMMVVDWQTVTLGLGVTDVGYLLAGGLEPENRRAVEHELLAEYIAELGTRGVEYSMEQCLADYALGSLHGVIIAVTATTMADQTERGDALFTLMINRHGRHALDFDVLDRLERELN